MPKLLLQYKGVPAVLNNRFKKIDNITFITVCTTGNNDYKRQDFDDLEKAIDFCPENLRLKLVFVYLKSAYNGTNYVIYQSINFANNKLFISDTARVLHKGFRFTVDFGLESFRLKKIKVSGATTKSADYEFTYVRRKTITSQSSKKFALLDSYYEMFPRFEDIFLETLFMLDIMSTNYTVTNKDELEAYFLQVKSRIKVNSIPPLLEINNEVTTLSNEVVALNKESDEQIELSNLVGLDTIKLEIQELKALALFRKKRIEYKLPFTPSTLHMVFTGNLELESQLIDFYTFTALLVFLLYRV